MNLLYYHQKSLNIVRSSFYFSPSWLTWLRVKYFRFTFSPVHRSRCNPHYLAQNSRCCQVIFKNRPVKCAIRWRRDTTGLTGLVRHKLVTETVPLSYRLSSPKQRSVDESIRCKHTDLQLSYRLSNLFRLTCRVNCVRLRRSLNTHDRPLVSMQRSNFSASSV